MSRLIRSIVASAIIGIRKAPSSFAVHFRQPLCACYGQAIGGDDEILFPPRGPLFSVPEAAPRH